MSGHRKFSELTKKFSPEHRRLFEIEKAELLAKIDREIHIEPIVLEWSEWHPWLDVERDTRHGGVIAPSNQPGVYEVRFRTQQKRLIIEKSNNLRLRIEQGLVRGSVPHPAGEKIRADMKHSELSASDVSIRWAVTDRPAAVAEELFLRHEGRFGALPKYNGLVQKGRNHKDTVQQAQTV
jgi:hypothetical protein